MCYRPPLLVLLSLVLMAVEAPPGALAGLGVDGTVSLAWGGQEFCTLSAHWADPRWRQARASWAGSATAGPVRSLRLACDQAAVDARVMLAGQDGVVVGSWTFTARSAAAFGQLGVLVALPADLAGGRWEADGATGPFPAVAGAEFRLHRGPARRVAISDRAGHRLELVLATEAVVQVQDDRRWQSGFSLRIGAQEGRLATGERLELELRLSAPGGIAVAERAPTVIAAGPEWIPLAPSPALSPEPGSALDLSPALPPAGPVTAPLIATPEGHFASADAPGARLRFYGVNLCGDAQFLPPEQVERLCDRFLRLGYNALRIHHWEATLGSGPDGEWDPARLAQLDHLLAACGARGIRVAIDLYCSRPPVAARLALPAGQEVDFQGYKVLVPVHEPAFADWAAHARRLLDHRNPRTGLRWADDPTLSWVALINEGNPGNFWRRLRTMPQWTAAWNRWLAAQRGARAELAAAWGDLAADEDAAAGSVRLPESWRGPSRRQADAQAFVADTLVAMQRRMIALVRGELGCRALITNLNGWTSDPADLPAREALDFVDDHFYVDHPVFLDREWRLPSRCGNTNPLLAGATGGAASALLRLPGRPFTISEFNYSGPGRFRAMGGILTGALAGVQDWDGVWRFAYAHAAARIETPAASGYFDLASDPLNQLADRAAVLLYRGGLVEPARREVVVSVERAVPPPPAAGEAVQSRSMLLQGWGARLGTAYADRVPAAAIALPVARLAADPAATLAAAGLDPDPAATRRSLADGGLVLDGRDGSLLIDLPSFAGGYAEPGARLEAAKAGLAIAVTGSGATVYVAAFDRQPIASSRRLLICHLTDLQNTGATYLEENRRTLLAWGGLPHLVRRGEADVMVTVQEPALWRVHALDPAGRRQEALPVVVVDGRLQLHLDVQGAQGARMCYEAEALERDQAR